MIKSVIAKLYASFTAKKVSKWANNPVESQQNVFRSLIAQASRTDFGKDHHFGQIKSYKDFQERVPVRDYEGLRTYVDEIRKGKEDVLWPGQPLYFAKTSGTTSGAKYIPISKESMPYHISAARDALLLYIAETGRADFVNGKMIFLQGSPEVSTQNNIRTGRLSGIVAHYVPKYLQRNRMPSWEVNCIDDWETKVNAIVEETVVEDMRLISGIPSWVQMYFEKLVAKKQQPISKIFPNFKLFVYGGVNYEPYRKKMEELIGESVDSIELFPASEGFFAYQDLQNKDPQKKNGMLLLLDGGIFYEFIKADEFFNDNPRRYTIEDVELGVNYALIISTNAGLWAYNIGDTIEFTSLKPYRIIVTGRIKHFISAFGEHVIAKEVEQAMQNAVLKYDLKINEFTVAPMVNPIEGLPYHEWLVEFEETPKELEKIIQHIDQSMQEQNTYYFDLIEGKILQPLVITKVAKNGFKNYMKSVGKLGGQNKIPRLSNDRKIADAIEKIS